MKEAEADLEEEEGREKSSLKQSKTRVQLKKLKEAEADLEEVGREKSSLNLVQSKTKLLKKKNMKEAEV